MEAGSKTHFGSAYMGDKALKSRHYYYYYIDGLVFSKTDPLPAAAGAATLIFIHSAIWGNICDNSGFHWSEKQTEEKLLALGVTSAHLSLLDDEHTTLSKHQTSFSFNKKKCHVTSWATHVASWLLLSKTPTVLWGRKCVFGLAGVNVSATVRRNMLKMFSFKKHLKKQRTKWQWTWWP